MDNYSSLTEAYIKNLENKLRELGVDPSVYNPWPKKTKRSKVAKPCTADDLNKILRKFFTS